MIIHICGVRVCVRIMFIYTFYMCLSIYSRMQITSQHSQLLHNHITEGDNALTEQGQGAQTF